MNSVLIGSRAVFHYYGAPKRIEQARGSMTTFTGDLLLKRAVCLRRSSGGLKLPPRLWPSLDEHFRRAIFAHRELWLDDVNPIASIAVEST